MPKDHGRMPLVAPAEYANTIVPVVQPGCDVMYMPGAACFPVSVAMEGRT